jgi:hypothetical protein
VTYMPPLRAVNLGGNHPTAAVAEAPAPTRQRGAGRGARGRPRGTRRDRIRRARGGPASGTATSRTIGTRGSTRRPRSIQRPTCTRSSSARARGMIAEANSAPLRTEPGNLCRGTGWKEEPRIGQGGRRRRYTRVAGADSARGFRQGRPSAALAKTQLRCPGGCDATSCRMGQRIYPPAFPGDRRKSRGRLGRHDFITLRYTPSRGASFVLPHRTDCEVRPAFLAVGVTYVKSDRQSHSYTDRDTLRVSDDEVPPASRISDSHCQMGDIKKEQGRFSRIHSPWHPQRSNRNQSKGSWSCLDAFGKQQGKHRDRAIERSNERSINSRDVEPRTSSCWRRRRQQQRP